MQGAAITAALGGQASAIISWLVATQQIYGKLTITTTAASGPSLAGNLVRPTRSPFSEPPRCEMAVCPGLPAGGGMRKVFAQAFTKRDGMRHNPAT